VYKINIITCRIFNYCIGVLSIAVSVGNFLPASGRNNFICCGSKIVSSTNSSGIIGSSAVGGIGISSVVVPERFSAWKFSMSHSQIMFQLILHWLSPPLGPAKLAFLGPWQWKLIF